MSETTILPAGGQGFVQTGNQGYNNGYNNHNGYSAEVLNTNHNFSIQTINSAHAAAALAASTSDKVTVMDGQRTRDAITSLYNLVYAGQQAALLKAADVALQDAKDEITLLKGKVPTGTVI